jgi:hypothetical protein
MPESARVSLLSLGNNHPSTKYFVREVCASGVNPSRIAVSYDFVPLKQVVVRTASQLQLIGCSHFSTFAIGVPI